MWPATTSTEKSTKLEEVEELLPWLVMPSPPWTDTHPKKKKDLLYMLTSNIEHTFLQTKFYILHWEVLYIIFKHLTCLSWDKVLYKLHWEVLYILTSNDKYYEPDLF
jgi:hypothetical protein